MRIRPKYHSMQDAPMAYYKFLTRFSLLAGMLLNLVRFFNSISFFSNDHFWGNVTDAVTLLSAFILCVVSLILLNQMDWRGVVALLSISAIEIIYCMALFGFMLINGAGWEGGSLIGTAIGYGAILIINWIYFSKRRLLFTPSPKWAAIPTERYEAQEAQMHSFIANSSAREDVSSSATPKETVFTYQPDFEDVSQEEKKEHSARFSPKWKCSSLIFVVSIIIALCGLSYSIYMGYRVNELQSELEFKSNAFSDMERSRNAVLKEKNNLEEQLSDYEDQIESLALPAYILDEQVGFIVSGSKYYHHYDCPVFQAESEFWAHNIEYCQSLGYSKCPICWEDSVAITRK